MLELETLCGLTHVHTVLITVFGSYELPYYKCTDQKNVNTVTATQSVRVCSVGSDENKTGVNVSTFRSVYAHRLHGNMDSPYSTHKQGCYCILALCFILIKKTSVYLSACETSSFQLISSFGVLISLFFSLLFFSVQSIKIIMTFSLLFFLPSAVCPFPFFSMDSYSHTGSF